MNKKLDKKQLEQMLNHLNVLENSLNDENVKETATELLKIADNFNKSKKLSVVPKDKKETKMYEKEQESFEDLIIKAKFEAEELLTTNLMLIEKVNGRKKDYINATNALADMIETYNKVLNSL